MIRELTRIIMPSTKTDSTLLPIRRISRRQEGENVVRDISILQRTMNRLRGGALVPKGIYRFQSHEEADTWMMSQIVSTHVRPSLKTS